MKFVISKTSDRNAVDKKRTENFNTLEELLSFIEDLNEEVIITPPGFVLYDLPGGEVKKEIWELEIYDDYRE